VAAKGAYPRLPSGRLREERRYCESNYSSSNSRTTLVQTLDGAIDGGLDGAIDGSREGRVL